MAFDFKNLDHQTRQLMLEEIDQDIKKGELYPSKYFTATGKEKYLMILKETIANDDTEETLANELKSQSCFKSYDEAHPRKDGRPSKVPSTAHITFAEGQYNRFYIRALCQRVLNTKDLQLEVYRAKQVRNPRPESQALIGSTIEPDRLLTDLRENIVVGSVLGGPNSGLSVRIRD